MDKLKILEEWLAKNEKSQDNLIKDGISRDSYNAGWLEGAHVTLTRVIDLFEGKE